MKNSTANERVLHLVIGVFLGTIASILLEILGFREFYIVGFIVAMVYFVLIAPLIQIFLNKQSKDSQS